MVKKNSNTLGLAELTAVVFGMMVGAGIYNIPQNMAAGAGLMASSLAWIVTAAGMLLLVATFKILSDRRPDLKAGIYEYSQAGWGNYAGFNMAWGYWLCTAFANVAYAVMLNDTFGAFFPDMLDNHVSEVIFGSVLIWIMFAVVCRGMRTAKFVNNLLAVMKVSVILVIIVILVCFLRADMLNAAWDVSFASTDSLETQIKNTMMVTLWCFIGIEGAVMMSARARKASDVGKAGVLGFTIAWLMYVLVSVLSFGIMTRTQLMGLDNPSAAYLLRSVCGDWAYYFVIVAVIVSLLGGWVSWTLVCAQVPYEAASVGILPRRFLRLNRQGMPSFGLAVSSVIMQVFLLLVVAANNVYLAALSITGMMILPAYFFSGLYLCKSTIGKTSLGAVSRGERIRFLLTGILCAGFCLWMMYAGGFKLLLMTSAFYICGIGFFIKARRERTGTSRISDLFSPAERVAFLLLVLATIASAFLF